MILTADEVGRSLSGSIKLLNRDPEGLSAFDTSISAFWHSFAAIVLTAPAFVVALAEDRAALGLPLEAGLFADTWLVGYEIVGLVLGWIAFPLAMIAVVHRLSLGHRYIRFVIAYNWSAVLAATIFAIPNFLLLIGFATPGLSALFAFGFAIIVAQYRWFIAKSALGVSGFVASGLVMLDFGLNCSISAALAALI